MTPFTYHRRVQFAETDLAGIVHFSMLFRYMEEAEHALWRSVGASVAERGGDLGWPRLTAALEFRRPLRFEDEFEVRMAVTRTTTRTIEYACTIRRGEDVIAEGTMSAICARRQPDGTMRAAEIPPGLADRLKNAGR